MAHEITGSRFISRGVPAWHGLGTVFPSDAKISPLVAVMQYNMAVPLSLRPFTVTADDGTVIPIADQSAIVRGPIKEDDAYRVFGTVGNDYQIISNELLAYMLEPLGETLPLDTMAVLKNGEGFFVTFRGDTWDIGGDEVTQYIVAHNWHNGRGGLVIMQTPIRVVCMNTLVMGESAATITSSTQHRAGATDAVAVKATIFAAINKRQQDARGTLSAMAAYRITDDELSTIIGAAFKPRRRRETIGDFIAKDDTIIPEVERLINSDPSIVEATGRMLVNSGSVAHAGRMAQYRQAAMTAYARLNDEYPHNARSAWHAYNAVTEVATHYTLRDRSDGVSGQDILFGARAGYSQRAYDAAVAVMSGSND